MHFAPNFSLGVTEKQGGKKRQNQESPSPPFYLLFMVSVRLFSYI